MKQFLAILSAVMFALVSIGGATDVFAASKPKAEKKVEKKAAKKAAPAKK